MERTSRLELVPVDGLLHFTDANWEKAKYLLLEFQPARQVELAGTPPRAIRVEALGEHAEVAPAILARLAELAGVELRVDAPPNR